MNVLILGGGGREHALADSVSKSPHCTKLFCAPGNAGTAGIALNVQLNPNDAESVAAFCKVNCIELVIIGPELPLVNGTADALRKAGFPVFGPSAAAARIESDKAFAKSLMKKFGVPTASYQEYSAQEYEKLLLELRSRSFPVVLKANGLAAGKGVCVAASFDEAASFLKDVFVNKIFGTAGDTLIVEDFLAGEEASVFAICDGQQYITLPAAQDHKRIGEGDTGKNTGGMGAYAPAPLVTPDILNLIKSEIIEPMISGMKEEGIPFLGCLYCGLMIENGIPKVVEFNCRFGDPETQVVLPLLDGDLLTLLYTAAVGSLDLAAVSYTGGFAVTVVAASGGYPDSFRKGFPISGLDFSFPAGIKIFHAGTKFDQTGIITDGGRVLCVTAHTPDFNPASALSAVYAALEHLSFDNMYYRHDIAGKL